MPFTERCKASLPIFSRQLYSISLAGDARNEVMTTRDLSKLKFDPSIYRANALQGLVYDPARELPHIKLHKVIAHYSIHVSYTLWMTKG